MNISRRNIFTLAVAAIATAATYAASRTFRGPMMMRKLTAAEKSACGLTVETTEGPFWVSGLNELKEGVLNASGLNGVPIEVAGRVLDSANGDKPIANAEVEIWHADSEGNYHPNGNGSPSGYKPEEIALRGFVKTDAEGRYRFTSIYPGEYTGRVRHFHFKIRSTGKTELTTQLVVPPKPGDTLTFETDDIAEGLPNCQLLAVDETVTPAKASFDFRV